MVFSVLLVVQCILVALTSLVLVLDYILDLQLSHTLDLIQIYNETFIISVQGLYTLSTEYC